MHSIKVRNTLIQIDFKINSQLVHSSAWVHDMKNYSSRVHMANVAKCQVIFKNARNVGLLRLKSCIGAGLIFVNAAVLFPNK